MRKFLLVALLVPFLAVPATAESLLSPLNPPGWSDLDSAAAKVAYWINGARLCHINYDPVALEARTQQFAALYGVTVSAVKREAPKWADRFAPNVTRDTCRSATQQAKRLGILAGYKPPRNFPPTPRSAME
ncbi:MAG TPA: hypothetical protein VL147_20130 [Devosia sp.]|nr:hypothetical protein [Devosia sp.]